jgi:hypothetical protein
MSAPSFAPIKTLPLACPVGRRRYAYAGRSLTLPAWSEELGIPLATLRRRRQLGWSVFKTLSTPWDGRTRLRGLDKPMTALMMATLEFMRSFQAEHGRWPIQRELARHFGVHDTTIRGRLEALAQRGVVHRGADGAYFLTTS